MVRPMGKNSEENEKNIKCVKARGRHGRLIIVTAIITSIVVLAVIFIGIIIPHLDQETNTLVGLWHITTQDTIYNGKNISSPADIYIVFNSTGNGYIYNPYIYGATRTNFTWHNTGCKEICTCSSGNKTTYRYSLHGNNIVLKSYYRSVTTILYGMRASKIPHIEEDLIVMLIYAPKSSNLTGGWANFTVEATNPSALVPAKVHIYVNGTEMMYSQRITGDNQWSYMDTDHSGEIDTGDIITVHSLNIAPNTPIKLTYKGYRGSSSGMIPPPNI